MDEPIKKKGFQITINSKVIIITAIIVALGLIGYVSYKGVNSWKDNIFKEGQINGSLEETKFINQYSVIPVITDATNMTINWVGIDALCSARQK